MGGGIKAPWEGLRETKVHAEWMRRGRRGGWGKENPLLPNTPLKIFRPRTQPSNYFASRCTTVGRLPQVMDNESDHGDTIQQACIFYSIYFVVFGVSLRRSQFRKPNGTFIVGKT